MATASVFTRTQQADVLDHIHMIGNTIFNHGVPSQISGPKANILMSGVDSEYPVIQDNVLYYSPFESSGRNLDLKSSCINGTISGNYSAGGMAVDLVRGYDGYEQRVRGPVLDGHLLSEQHLLDAASDRVARVRASQHLRAWCASQYHGLQLGPAALCARRSLSRRAAGRRGV